MFQYSVTWGAQDVDWRIKCFHVSVRPTLATRFLGNASLCTGILGLSPFPHRKECQGGEIVKQVVFIDSAHLERHGGVRERNMCSRGKTGFSRME